jgi:hypothetical protein
MIIDILINIIQALLGVVVIGLITRSSRKPSEPDIQGRHFLKMSKAYFYFGYTSILLSVIFLIAPFFDDMSDFRSLILMFVAFAMFSIMGFVCIKYYRNHYLIFDKYGVEVQSFLKVTVIAKWKDIEDGYYNPLSGNMVLRLTNKREKLKINQHLVGLPSFIKQLQENTGINSIDLQLPIK